MPPSTGCYLYNLAFWHVPPPILHHPLQLRGSIHSDIAFNPFPPQFLPVQHPSSSARACSGEDNPSEREQWLSDFRWRDPRYLWHDRALEASNTRYPARAAYGTYIDAQQQTNMKKLLLEAPWNMDYTAPSFTTSQDATEKWVFRSHDGTALNGTWTRRSEAGILCELNSIVHSSTDVCLARPSSSSPSSCEPVPVALIGMSSLPGQPAVASNILMLDGNEANRAYLMFCTLPGFQQRPSAFSTPGSIYSAHITLPICYDLATGAQRCFTLTTSPRIKIDGRQRWCFSLSETVSARNGQPREILLVSGTSDSESGITVAFNYDTSEASTMPRHRNCLDIPGEMSLIHFLLLCLKDQRYRVHRIPSATR